MTLTDLFDEAIRSEASDIHLAAGEQPCLRIDGRLVRLDIPSLEAATMAELVEPVLSADGAARLAAGLAVERTIPYLDTGFAGIVFRFATDRLAATFRLLRKGAPPLASIAFDAMPLFQKIIDSPRGFVVIAGPTGSGKTTTAQSIVDRINETKEARIFVVESHPAYCLGSKLGMLTQIHVGQDCDSYERALDIAHQADLDVVAVDDIPTAEVLRQLVVLADAGHLVIANLHATGAVDAIERLLAAAGSDSEAFRKALGQNLLAVTAQKLLKRTSRPGRVAAYEWIVPTGSVRQAILANDLVRLTDLQSSDPECRTALQATEALIAAGELDR